MELMVREGDYVGDEAGGFRSVTGSEELLQRVLWKLSIPRGSFPLLPRLGSDLWLLSWALPSRRTALARQYVAQALADEPELEITQVTLESDGRLQVELTWLGEALTVTLETGGM